MPDTAYLGLPDDKTQCPLCNDIVDMVYRHHVRYLPQITTEVCPSCHWAIHNRDGVYDALDPPISRKRADELEFDELTYTEALLLALALGLIDQPADDWHDLRFCPWCAKCCNVAGSDDRGDYYRCSRCEMTFEGERIDKIRPHDVTHAEYRKQALGDARKEIEGIAKRISGQIKEQYPDGKSPCKKDNF